MEELVAGVIAAVVSLTVALITVVINRNALRVEREKFERELQRNMTARLYDLRIESYPKGLEVTEGLRRSRLVEQGDGISEEYFKNMLAQLDTWHATKAGFLLSHKALHRLYDLRDALRDKPVADGKYSKAQIEKIWQAKGAFRSALRADIRLLYKEEDQELRED